MTQPPPVANDGPLVVPEVQRFLTARMEQGIRTYGVALQPGNGRDALVDAFEEAADRTWAR